LLVTTTYEPSESLICSAKKWARELGGIYKDRGKRSISRLHQIDPVVLVVMNEGLKAHKKGYSVPLFFHPGIAMLRIKRLMRGDNDTMIDICSLRLGDSFLDCTLGFGGDALVASYVLGEKGRVVGIESEPLIAAIVKEGFSTYPALEEIQRAMKRIEIIHRNHLTFLQQCENNSFDIVYFDPMFSEPIEHSHSISPLRPFANPSSLREEIIREAKRVARRRVVMKNHVGSEDFARLGFSSAVLGNRERTFTYGIILTGESSDE
jgi:hypothetical protein